MLAVGVGCFWFSVKHPTGGIKPGENPFVEHLNDVKSALEDIDNVSDLEICIDDKEFPERDSESTPDGDDSPLFINGLIEFDLYLPVRVQEHYGFGQSVEVETFHVSVTYNFYFPVTFIYYSVPDDDDVVKFRPSISVVIARKFLEERLKSHQKVKFNFIGPSPLHAEIIVKSLEGGENESTVELVSRAYKTILIKVLNDEGELTQVIMDRYQDILSCYYRITRCIESLYRNHESIICRVRELVDISGSKWPLANLKAMSNSENIISEIFNNILEDKMERLSVDSFVNEEKKTGTINNGNILHHFIDDAISEIPTLPTDEIRKVVDIIEGRRNNFFQNGATLLAGLLGAIIGALLTVILSH